MDTLQEKYKNQKNKNKNIIPDQNKNTCQQFIFYISSTNTNTFIIYISGTFEDFERTVMKSAKVVTHKLVS